jgi:diguanylate cyclase (GGDEF)-like protein
MGRFFQNVSIRMKAFAASAVLLICLVALGGHAYQAAENSARDLNRLSNITLPERQAIADLSDDALAIHVKVFRFVTWASNGVNVALLKSISNEALIDIAATSRRLELFEARRDLSSAERSRIAELLKEWKIYAGAVTDVLDVGRTDAPMATMMLGATDDDFQKIDAHLHEMSDLASVEMQAAAHGLVATAEGNKRVLAVGGAIGALLSLIVTLVIGRSIVQPIQAVTRAMTEVSAGNMDFDLGDQSRKDEIGQMVRAIASFRRNLLAQNLRLDTALNNMSQGLCMFDAAQRVIICNDRYARMYGLSPDQVTPGTTLRQIVEHRIANGIYAGLSPQEYLGRQLVSVTKSATVIRELSDGRTLLVSVQPMPNGGFVTTHENITESRQAEKRIAHMAHHDGLTDLPNRLLFREQIEEAVKRIPPGEHLAILCLDLDGFKNVNDTLGHPVGDTLLRSVADRLRTCVRSVDAVARLGGDEFAIAQIGAHQPEGATLLARRVIEELSATYEIDGHHVVIGASVGIAIAPSDGSTSEELFKNGDMALYRAKFEGRGTYRFFEPEMDARMQARRTLELDLREALVEGQFEVFYQPVVNLKSGRITSFEALLRWHHPSRGLVSPAEFIPLAEEIALIAPIGEWVLRQACTTAATWPANITVAVNVSPAQFRGKKLFEAVITALAISKLAASRLELEITEGVLLVDTDATLALLHQLRTLGVRIAMDDFGTGYSSLSYLRSFPFDKIKIDRSFIHNMSDEGSSLAIIRAVTGLSASLGMITTAEGVETEEQLDRVRIEGCTEVQGFLFSEARPASEVAQLLATVGRHAMAAA